MSNRRNFLKYWATPAVIAVSLPKHAHATCCDGASRPIDVSASNVACDSVLTPNVASFTLCNNEADSVSVYASHTINAITISEIAPALPFSIPVGGCVGVQIKLNTCPVNTSLSFDARLENTAVVGGFTVPYV